jgi:hypothetical protein
LYPYLSLYTLSPSSYMSCSCFVLSFDACIVTITWSLLFVVIALWVIYLARLITLAPHSSSALPMLVCFLVFHRSTGKNLALLTNVVFRFKSFSEHPRLAWKCGTYRTNSLVRALIHHTEDVASRPNLGCCIPLCGFLVAKQSRQYSM